ncbi:type II toxin-antitoxin system RelE family toxin [Larkinella sp. VNQ87]|uniref:type II toxin-antitoxin system RelE family toxin n=1 Tax=Larkinella sp. VNQ87 TaxID=3400921 RepID=UPI003C0710DD
MSKYKLVITKSAEKELVKLPVQVIQQIQEAVLKLADDPRPAQCKKLKGFKDLYRIRIGDYRIIYSIRDSVLIVEVLRIGNRKDIYS